MEKYTNKYRQSGEEIQYTKDEVNYKNKADRVNESQ